MEESLIHKSWKNVYSHISEPSPALSIPIMETVVFDSIEPYRPLQWIYNTESGVVVSKDVRAMNISEVIQALVRKTAAVSTVHRYLPQSGSSEPMAVAVVGRKRMVLSERNLPSLQLLYPKGLEGLTLLKYNGKNFDPRVFFYQMVATETSYDDSVRVRARDTMEQDLEGIAHI